MVANTDIRDTLHILAEQLPEDATWEDVIERIRLRQAVAEGKRAAESGDFATDEEVRRVFAKFGAKV